MAELRAECKENGRSLAKEIIKYEQEKGKIKEELLSALQKAQTFNDAVNILFDYSSDLSTDQKKLLKIISAYYPFNLLIIDQDSIITELFDVSGGMALSFNQNKYHLLLVKNTGRLFNNFSTMIHEAEHLKCKFERKSAFLRYLNESLTCYREWNTLKKMVEDHPEIKEILFDNNQHIDFFGSLISEIVGAGTTRNVWDVDEPYTVMSWSENYHTMYVFATELEELVGKEGLNEIYEEGNLESLKKALGAEKYKAIDVLSGYFNRYFDYSVNKHIDMHVVISSVLNDADYNSGKLNVIMELLDLLAEHFESSEILLEEEGVSDDFIKDISQDIFYDYFYNWVNQVAEGKKDVDDIDFELPNIFSVYYEQNGVFD